MIQFFQGAFFPQGPPSRKVMEKFVKITVWLRNRALGSSPDSII